MFLKKVNPTPEQKKIFFLDPDKPTLITGRAGSGKTTTAILRAVQQFHFFKRQGFSTKIGFFVFNNALKTYLNSLAATELNEDQYEVWTIDHWCRNFLDSNGLMTKDVADDAKRKQCLREAIKAVELGSRRPQLIQLGEDFLIEEVDYLLGRFGLDTNQYIASAREGRGNNPNVDHGMKVAIAEEIIPSYQYVLESRGLIDWNQMRYDALSYLVAGVSYNNYDIVVIDEAQDLCALQIHIALTLISAQTNAITFIGDNTQRIYKNNYLWNDVNLNFKDNHLDLHKNFRNTQQIAAVAANLMQSEEEQNDIDPLDPNLTLRTGAKPIWVKGKYSLQKKYLVTQLQAINSNTESVGILHVQRQAADDLAKALLYEGYRCECIHQFNVCLNASGGIYVSTLHSAKGLEFDHTFIVGYDEFFAPGTESLSHRETSAHLSAHRKLLYTAISRARQTLTILSSTNQYSRFLANIDPNLLNIKVL